MTTAKQILTHIENVDPSDTAKLDEIDAKVAEYLRLPVKKFNDVNEKELPLYMVMTDCGNHIDFGVPRYTRSLDAIDNIQPKGWYVNIQATQGADRINYFGISHQINASCALNSPKEMVTEKLCRLHCVIQSVEFERSSCPAPS